MACPNFSPLAPSSGNGYQGHRAKRFTMKVFISWQVSWTISRRSCVSVSNGLFTVKLDFGAGAFNGNARWLELAVRTNGVASFTPLSPRQNLTPTAYAIAAGNLSGTLSAGQLTGTVPSGLLAGT